LTRCSFLRWPVSGEQAKTLAVAFYEALAQRGDMALLEARKKVAGEKQPAISFKHSTIYPELNIF
jgi:hypothetical protein